jgi:hypothetical protein
MDLISTNHQKPEIINTNRGLQISGTRITICDIFDYLKAQYPPQLIREKLGLNQEQIEVALAYINSHQTEVEIEYQNYLKGAEEIRKYWDNQNRERFAKIALMSPKTGQEALRAKLKAWKERIESQL